MPKDIKVTYPITPDGKLDTELVEGLNIGTVTVDKTKIWDGTNYLSIDASGRLAVQNPSNLDVALSTRATESTLLVVKSKVDSMDTTLTSIDGKITTCDTSNVTITGSLPAGSNLIGEVNAYQAGTWSVGRTWSLSSATDSVTTTLGTSDNVIGRVKITDGTTVAGVDSTTTGLKTVISDSLPAGTNTIGNVNAIQSGTWSVGRTWNLSSSTDSVFADVTPDSPSATDYLPTRLTDGTSFYKAAADHTTATDFSSVRLTDGTGFYDARSRTWNLSDAVDSVTVSGTVSATQSGSWSVGRTWNLSSATDSVTTTGSVKRTLGSTATYGAVSVGSSPTIIRSSNSARRSLIIQNNSTVDVYIGTDSSVTTSNGLKLLPDTSISITDSTTDWYGVVASGTADVRYIEEAD
ncbi:MAG: hypothetical protein ACTSX6_00375 [Candidatus Heimdallarchaeaceae archaeon]